MQGQIEVARSSLIGSIVIYSLLVWHTLFSHMVAFLLTKWYCSDSWNLLLDGRLRQTKPRLQRFCYENYCLPDDGVVHISNPAYHHIVHIATIGLPSESPTP